jgi:hypothetical protein
VIATRRYEHELGLSWVVEEALQRASHALRDDEGRVWLIDPVDDDGPAIAAALALGSPAGVLQLFGEHGRDGEALAGRLGVPLLTVPASVPGSPFEVVRVLSGPGWREVALWWPSRRALMVPELIGTAPHMTLGSDRWAGMHPVGRLVAPGALRPFQPEHLLPGHGAPLHGTEASTGLQLAYANARRDMVRLPKAVGTLVGAARGRWG